MPQYDISDLVRVDPQFETCGLALEGFRLTQAEHVGEDFFYNATCRVRRNGRAWPNTTLRVLLYGADNLVVDEIWLYDWRKTTEKGVRVVSSTAICPNIAYAELVPDVRDESADDGWSDVEVSRDSEAEAAIGLAIDGLLCQKRQDFETSNLTLIELNGAIRSSDVVPANVGLRVTVLGTAGQLLTSVAAVVAPRGPRRKRTFSATCRVYNHLPIACVALEFEDDHAPQDETMALVSPAHAATIVASLTAMNRKLDTLQETLEAWNAD